MHWIDAAGEEMDVDMPDRHRSRCADGPPIASMVFDPDDRLGAFEEMQRRFGPRARLPAYRPDARVAALDARGARGP